MAGLRVITAYVPNGKAVTRVEDWNYKLEWLGGLREHLAGSADPEEPLVLCGDFNVAPSDRDSATADPGGVLCHPDARTALAGVVGWGLTDAYREIYAEGDEPEKGLYTWWDYTRLAFAKNVGARIDHIYLTAPLAGRITVGAGGPGRAPAAERGGHPLRPRAGALRPRSLTGDVAAVAGRTVTPA